MSTKDITGKIIKIGDVVGYVSAGARIDMGIVIEIKFSKSGRLLGHVIKYPYKEKEIKKLLSSGRELVVLNIHNFYEIDNSQAHFTHKFGNRLAYINTMVIVDDRTNHL